MIYINPETREVFTAYYRPKLFLILLVYLLIPSRINHLKLPDSITNPDITSQRISIFEPKRVVKQVVLKDSVPLTSAYSRDHDEIRNSRNGSPVTIDKPTSMSKGALNTLDDLGDTQQSSSTDVPSATPGAHLNTLTRIPISSSFSEKSSNWDQDGIESITTTVLSSQETNTPSTPSSMPTPSTPDLDQDDEPIHFDDNLVDSALQEEDCPIDYRGRPLCPNTTRPPLSIRKRSHELSSELADAVSEFGAFVLLSGHLLIQSLFKIEISPFFLFLFLLHSLYLIQFFSLIMEDTILRTTLSNPLPPDFKRGKTFSKRLTRLKFRWAQTWERFPLEISGMILSGLVVGVLGVECWRGEKMEVWEDVPFSWILKRVVKDTGDELKVIGPMREMIVLEIIATLSSLLQPLKHLLPTSIIPTNITSPSWLYTSPPVIAQSSSFFPPTAPPRSSNATHHLHHHHQQQQQQRRTSPRMATATPTTISRTPSPPPPLALLPLSHSHEKLTFSSPPSPKIHSHPSNSNEIPISLSTIWLLSLFSESLNSFLTALQFLSLILILKSYSPLTVAPHIIFHAVRGRVGVIMRNKEVVLRSVECLKTVFRVFPEDEEEEIGGKGRKEEREEDRDWMCTICFEGVSEFTSISDTDVSEGRERGDTTSDESEEEESERKRNFIKRKTGNKLMGQKCRLPCGHKFHPNCLIPWFRVQSFCPVCHASVVTVTPLPTSSTPLTPPTFNTGVNEGDIFPGNLRRRNVVDVE